MEFFPDVEAFSSSPKGFYVLNTLAAVVITALGMRFWMRRLMKKSVKTGSFVMQGKDFGDASETRRDVRAPSQKPSLTRNGDDQEMTCVLLIALAPLARRFPVPLPPGASRS